MYIGPALWWSFGWFH